MFGRIASDVSWELGLFKQSEMLERVATFLVDLLERGEQVTDQDGSKVFVQQSALFALHPDHVEYNGVMYRLRVSVCQTIVDVIRNELAVRGELRDRGVYARSNAASTIQHRLSEFRLDEAGDRQGRDLQRRIGSYVSAAISEITPVSTAPISHAQRVVEIQRQAERAVSTAAADPAGAARNLRRISEAIKVLSESIESNMRHKRQ